MLWEMGFPAAKISCDSDVRGDFAGFPNRQNRSALADLKTLWAFNLLAGVDFYARGLRPSRALPGDWGALRLPSRAHPGLGRASLALLIVSFRPIFLVLRGFWGAVLRGEAGISVII